MDKKTYTLKREFDKIYKDIASSGLSSAMEVCINIEYLRECNIDFNNLLAKGLTTKKTKKD